MRILVTGGGGFIGSHLVDSHLAQGHYVRTVDLDVALLKQTAGQPGLEVVQGDIVDRELLQRLVEGIDVVYHLASAHLDVSLPEERYWQVNVDATKNLLQAAADAGVDMFVQCSTNGVVGEIRKPPVDETVACRPTNIYEQTKLAGEQAALRFYAESGFPVVVVRPAWVYGPRCPRTQKLMRNIKKRRFPMFGDGQTMRHPVYISDAVKGLELCVQVKESIGQVYFIAGETPVTIEHLVNLIAKLQGVRPPFLRLPMVAGKGIGYALEFAFKILGGRPPFSRRSVDFYLKHNAYDISKARRELGYEPQVDLCDGLKRTLDWQIQNNS